MIIDCHVHAKGGDTYRREFPPEMILRTMDEAGVDKSVVFSICLPGRESNNLTARCCKAAPDRLIPFAHVWPEEGRQALIEIDRAVEQLGCRGLKLHVGEMPDASADPLKPVCEKATQVGLPVLIDVATRLDIATELVESVPGMKLIIAHLGAPNSEALVERFIALAWEHPNIWRDSSYSSCPWKIADAIERLGPDRVVFGSDGPIIHPAIELMKIRVCNLSQEDFEKVTWRNIESLML